MRLLQIETLRFKEFYEDECPSYAILSHRWANHEVTLQDFESERARWPRVQDLRIHYRQLQAECQGFWKIVRACDVAESEGFQYIWIDTCCIDKSSSAELSEAINSMYRWYHQAVKCYAYLCDFNTQFHGLNSEREVLSSFCRSEWFTRGWTLQELLAPSNIMFLDQEWNQQGTREELSDQISVATGIDVVYLRGAECGGQHFRQASVARRMSWVSRRQTSRVEDIAYCMLGMFGVSMPLLYGEGQKAFMRLQLEIIRKSDDESIFAWTSQSPRVGMLALSPTDFANSGDVWIDDLETSTSLTEQRLPYSMTNKGLELRILVDWWATEDYEEETTLDIGLNCWRGSYETARSIIISLQRRGRVWQRIEQDKLLDRLHVHSSVRRSSGIPYGAAPKTVTLYVKQDGI